MVGSDKTDLKSNIDPKSFVLNLDTIYLDLDHIYMDPDHTYLDPDHIYLDPFYKTLIQNHLC